MVTILGVRKYIDRILKKEQRGNVLSGDDFNIFINLAQSEHFDGEKRKAEITSDIIDSLEPFIKTETGVTGSPSAGDYILPTDYEKLLGTKRLYNGAYVGCDMVSQLEKDERDDNSLTIPTDKKPVVSIEGGYLRFIPTTNAYIKITYYRKPEELFLDWYWDANDQIIYLDEGETYTLKTDERYSDGTTSGTKSSKTIDFEWINDSDRIAIAHRVLMKLGITLPNDLAMQYGASETTKNDSKV